MGKAFKRQRQHLLLCVIAGLSYATLITIGYESIYRGGRMPVHPIAMIVVFAYPILPTARVIFALGPLRRLALLLVYFGCLLIFGLWLATSPLTLKDDQVEIPRQFVLFWAWLAYAFPTALFTALILARRIAAVGPIVALFVAVSTEGADIAAKIFYTSDARRMFKAGTYESEVQFIKNAGWIMAIGALAAAVVGWAVMVGIQKRYTRKRTSDQSLQISTIWAVHSVVMALVLAMRAGPLGVAAAASAFVVFQLVMRFARPWLLPAPSGRPRQLLLLRVFERSRKRVWLLDQISTLWRYIGPIELIAGPDLAGATVEPHEFLEFLRGKLSRCFIDSESALRRQLEMLDTAPDADGRFRINGFYCRADTWRVAVESFIGQSDAIVMDLRGFRAKNTGCAFEIKALQSALERAVFLTDRTTDLNAMERAFAIAADGTQEITVNITDARWFWSALNATLLEST